MSKQFCYKVLIGFLLSCGTAYAQDFALKTRLTHLATLSFDAGVEWGLSSRWTAELSATYNPWTFKDNTKWKILMIGPQVRYWPCQKFMGWFIAPYAHGGVFNIGHVPLPGLYDVRNEGWFVGGGLGAGYQVILSRHLNLELELGGGYAFSRHDTFLCHTCGEKLAENQPNHYWGLTKAHIALVYCF